MFASLANRVPSYIALWIAVTACNAKSQQANEQSEHVTPKKAPMATAEPDTAPLKFFYHDLSAFHRDGEVLWVSTSGDAFAQIVSRAHSGESASTAEGSDVIDRRYEFSIADDPVFETLQQLSETDPSQLQIVDRQGIPDEVRVRVSFRDSSGAFHQFDLWEADWPKQPETVRAFRQVASSILESARHKTPAYAQPASESLDYWPARIEKPSDDR